MNLFILFVNAVLAIAINQDYDEKINKNVLNVNNL